MNIAELARKLNINAVDLRNKLPELGFDIGQKAIKVDDRLAASIIRAWHEFKTRESQKVQYMKYVQPTEVDKEGVAITKKVEIPSVLTVKDFSELLKMPVTAVISALIKNGIMASMNQRIDFDTAAIIATDFGYEATEISLEEKVEVDKDKRIKDKLASGDQSNFITRPPIIVVMGHVDHGKTKLLDAIRKTNVVEGEAGGITQHIGAYQVIKKDRKLTFIDTPGHEAFSAMRSRGAKVADIAILVVAATEGAKPQTIEALKIAQEANIPIVVAINKIDLPEANPDKVKQELSQYNLLPEEWGGKTMYVPISAKLGQNIDALLDSIILLTDLNVDTIKANPDGEFVGSVIESHVDKGEGPVSTVLVKNGTLHVGDYIVIDGVLYGKIRMMRDYKGNSLTEAMPAMPAKILGLKVAPKVGDLLEAIDDPKKAKRVKAYSMEQEESFIKQPAEEETKADENITKLSVILRTDVLGSQEAIIETLKKMERQDLKIEIVSKALGNITESDILTAEATGAVVYGFHVLVPNNVAMIAREKKIKINNYKIIYELIDDVKEKLRAMIKPEIVREDLGKVAVLAVFKKGPTFEIVGGRVNQGKVEPGVKAAVLRNNEFIASGKITEIKVGKQEVKDVVRGQEFGLKFEGQPVIEIGDILDIYREKEVYHGL